MKRLLSLTLVIAVILSLTACGGKWGGGDDAFAFDHQVEIICPWAADSAADAVARRFAAQLEKAIGQPVTVNNVTGADGVSGVQYAMQQPADGYTWLLCSPAPLLAQISKATDYNVYSSVNPICSVVWDYNIFVTGQDAPYSDYKELMDYVSANPGSVQCGVLSLTGLDNACVTAVFDGAIEAVPYSEIFHLNSDIIGNYLGLACVTPAQAADLVETGDMKVIMTCTRERAALDWLSDIECAGDNGFNCSYGPYYGIFGPKDMPQDIIDVFTAAAQKAVASKDFQEWAAAQSLDQHDGWMGPDAYRSRWDSDYRKLLELFR